MSTFLDDFYGSRSLEELNLKVENLRMLHFLAVRLLIVHLVKQFLRLVNFKVVFLRNVT
jgi:hypothetical protein